MRQLGRLAAQLVRAAVEAFDAMDAAAAEIVIRRDIELDEEQKRLAKVKAIRDTKVRGRGTRAAEAAAAESAVVTEAAPESVPAEGGEPAPASA